MNQASSEHNGCSIPSELQGEAPITGSDLNALIRLLGEVAGLSTPLADRKRVLMDRLSELLDADGWIWTTSTGFSPGEVPAAVACSYGGFSDRQFGLLLEASQDADCPIPENEVMIADILQNGHITRTRSDWINDEQLHAHPSWKLYRKPAGTDHYLFSLWPIAGGCVSGIGLHRAPGRPDFTARERRMIHLVASNIDWLHIADLPENAPARVAVLSPRLRTVFAYLLQGWNRKRIADQLGLSANTIAGYQKDIYRRFEVNSQAELLSGFIMGDGGDHVAQAATG